MGRLRLLVSCGVLAVLFVAGTPSSDASRIAQGSTHMVQAEEHLTTVTNRDGSTPQAFTSANNLVNMNLLYVG